MEIRSPRRMASAQRRREDLYRVKTRELVFQYPDGSYPGLYRVAVIENGLGSVDWSPATIDMSGNMQLPGNLDVSGSATVDGTLTVGSTIYALSDVVVDGDVVVAGDLDVSGSLTVSSIETCALSASQGRFTVDCSYGYVSIQPNTGLPPGVTAGSYNDSRIDMYCGNGVTTQRSRLRLFAQERYDTAVTEGRLALIDSSDEYITPVIQFDASAEQLRILNYNLNEEVAVAINMSGQMAVGATWHDPNSRLTIIGRESIVLDTPPVGNTTGPILTCTYDPSYNSVARFQSLAVYPNQPAGTTAMYIISREYDTVSQNGAPLVLNPVIAGIVAGSGNVGVGASINPQTTLDVGGTFRIDRNPPATSTAAGVTGQIAWDENYLYVCVAGSSWARVGIAGW